MISEYYNSKKVKSTYGGKEYDICYLNVGADPDFKILLNDAIDDSIGTCELELPVTTWYTELKTTDDGEKYRIGNSAAITENLKIYPFILFGAAGTTTKSKYWRYGKSFYSVANSTGGYLFDVKTNTFCLRITGSVKNPYTGEEHRITLNDLLHPDNLYMTSNELLNGYLLDYTTNKFSSKLRSVHAGALVKGSTIGGVLDTSELSINNYSTDYSLSTGDSTSEGGGYTIIKDLDSRVKATPNLSELNIEYGVNTATINENWCITSEFTSTTQRITYHISLKFFVKLLQSLGCYVTVDAISETNTFTDDFLKNETNVLLGELNGNGHPTFNWLTAEDRSTSTSPNINNEWTTSDNTIAPKETPDKDNVIPTNYRISDQIGGFTMYYKCNQSDLLTLVNRVNFPSEQYPIPDGWEFTPHLVSCTQYPFNVSQYASGTTGNITIGSWNSGVSAINLNSTQLAVQTIADFTLTGLNDNFLDYSPYSQYQLYIPLCGWVDLPDNCVNKNITVDLATDVINNSCVGTVKANGCPVVHKSGIMGTSIAISATENGLKQAALTQSIFNTVGAVTSTGYALATQNAVGVVNGIVNVAGALTQGNIANNSNYTRQTGSTGDKSDKHVSNTCYLKISSVVASEPDNYSHTVGYMCNKTKQLSTCSGYTVCSNVDTTGLSCNQAAKDRIKRLLESGIYI